MDFSQKIRRKLEALVGDDFALHSYLIGVSGGKDSLCLLHLMASILPRKQLRVAHVNYKLRKRESDKDEALVRETCKKLSIPCLIYHPKVENSSELHLRNLRRSYFKNILKKERLDYVVLAHHAQDQLETLLMRMVRGTGMNGLGGMKEKNGRFLRPLLDSSPSEITSYITTNNIRYRIDASNASKQYFRNEVRHEIIPALEKTALRHGGVSSLYKKIADLTQQLQQTNKYLKSKTGRTYKHLVFENNFWLRFNREKFLHLSKQEKEWFLHFLILKLKGSPDRLTIERALKSIFSEKNLSLSENISLSVSCGEVFFQNTLHKKVFSKIQDPVSLGVSIPIPDGFELRFPRPGDRFRSAKLKKKLLEDRIPRLMRKILPVLARCGTSDVIWYQKSL